MNRKTQKCPYCGKRMSYFAAYFSRRKAEYVCPRCGKESRVVISKIIIPIFIIVAAISLAIMGIWFWLRYLSNPLGIVLVAAPLVIFLLLSPKFVQLQPLKKYEKSMEAKKAGIEFSDNLAALDLGDEKGAPETSGQFKINADVFNQIKAERSAPKETVDTNELVSDSKILENDSEIGVIDNVREEHATTTAYPLKKLHTEGSRMAHSRHYLPEQNLPEQPEEALDEEGVREYKKPDTNKYSANRRF